ncbi:MAG: DUF4345 family protein [Gammaproteobacteria bacterium]
MQARIILWLLGLSFIGFGIWALVAPAGFSNLVHFQLKDAIGVTEMRSFYGGLEFGLGAFFIFCAVYASAGTSGMRRAGLLLGVFVLGCLATARTFGLIIDGSASPVIFGALASEVLGALACFWALRFEQ